MPQTFQPPRRGRGPLLPPPAFDPAAQPTDLPTFGFDPFEMPVPGADPVPDPSGLGPARIGVVPEMQRLVDQAPTPGAGGRGDETTPALPGAGVNLDAYLDSAPQYDTARAGRLRTAGLVAAIGGGIAGLAGYGDSPLSALAQGVAAGAKGGLDKMDADADKRGEAFHKGFLSLLDRQAQIDAVATERELGRRSDVQRDANRERAADERQAASDAAADARRDEDARRQERRDLRATVERQMAAALEVGDVESYVALATEHFETDEATARTMAEGYAERVRRAELIQDRDYRVRLRGVAATEAAGALAAQRFRADRDDELYDRRNPPATRGGTGGRTGTRTAAPAPLIYRGQNLNDPAVEARLIRGGMTPARFAELRRIASGR